MLTYCFIDPAIVRRAAECRQLPGHSPKISEATQELSTVNGVVATKAEIVFLKRAAARHVFCDPCLGGVNNGVTLQKYFKNRLDKTHKREYSCVSWKAFSFGEKYCYYKEKLTKFFADFKDVQDDLPKNSTTDDCSVEIAYIFAMGTIVDQLPLLFYICSETFDIISYILIGCDDEDLHKCWDKIHKSSLRINFNTNESSVDYELSGFIDVFDLAHFLMSGSQNDRWPGLSMGFNMAHMKMVDLQFILNMLSGVHSHVCWVENNPCKNKHLDHFLQNIPSKNRIIINVKDLNDNDKKQWHDRFIIFCDGPSQQGKAGGVKFHALVFSAPLSHIVSMPNKFRQGTCVLRTHMDACENDTHENIFELLAKRVIPQGSSSTRE